MFWMDDFIKVLGKKSVTLTPTDNCHQTTWTSKYMQILYKHKPVRAKERFSSQNPLSQKLLFAIWLLFDHGCFASPQAISASIPELELRRTDNSSALTHTSLPFPHFYLTRKLRQSFIKGKYDKLLKNFSYVSSSQTDIGLLKNRSM